MIALTLSAFLRTHRRIFGCLLALALVAGCTSSEYTYSTTIAGGQRLSFRMVNGRVEPERADGLETLPPRLVPDSKDKKVRCAFALVAKGAPALKHVRVEDMSEERPVLLVDDAAPVTKGGLWVGESNWYTADSPELHWVTYLDNSFRVYRFTVTLADGRTVVLHQGFMFPDFMKGMMRATLGIKV